MLRGAHFARPPRGYVTASLAMAALGVSLWALVPAVPGRRDAWSAMQISRPRTPIQAPTFTLEDADGRRVSLAQLRGRAVILYFWTTW